MESRVNNAFYDELGDEWNHRCDHPIALLRAENRVRNPWILQEIGARIGAQAHVLDIGCGAGLLTNELAAHGHKATGVDLSEPSLEVARRSDKTKSVQYLNANGYALPCADKTFDAVAAMDVLEHVEKPEQLIKEASRVLKPGGLFFFHTFNRNVLSYLLIIKGVDWFVKNAPENMHVYPLFIRPKELEMMCRACDLDVVDWRGLAPVIFSRAMLQLLTTRQVSNEFPFQFTRSLATGYCGLAAKTQFRS